MASRLGVFLLLTLYGLRIAPDLSPRLIVWNVGQGLWATVISEDSCWHFDMGGEKMDWSQVINLCRRRRNHLSLSHWDMDHISFVSRARNALPQLCKWNTPLGPTRDSKRKMLSRVPDCEGVPPFAFWEDADGKTTNALSRVVQWQGVVMPGDSSRREEKDWLLRLPGLLRSRVLILGHHGSHTSTSRALLEQMPRLRMAIASARLQRYGHPHKRVVQDLEDFKIPLLRTEEWGNILIEL